MVDRSILINLVNGIESRVLNLSPAKAGRFLPEFI